jgi:hypothetical protein
MNKIRLHKQLNWNVITYFWPTYWQLLVFNFLVCCNEFFSTCDGVDFDKGQITVEKKRKKKTYAMLDHWCYERLKILIL